jgi:hypothetical protein
VVLADGHGTYDAVTLVARIERRSGYCRVMDTSHGVLDAHGHADSRPHGKAGALGAPYTLGMAATTGMRDTIGFR